jgi:hypothetical protein
MSRAVAKYILFTVVISFVGIDASRFPRAEHARAPRAEEACPRSFATIMGSIFLSMAFALQVRERAACRLL